ncbi:MAG: WbqC family protein [Candidatus Bathyarchaeota archaeon]|nr:WbqC family protein [Candidatus Bathyarchaeota archaeon]
MDLCPYDPFSRHSDRYQHRVKIGKDDNWKWFTLPIEACSSCSIMDVKLKTNLMNDRWRELECVYEKYPLWGEYKDALKEIFLGYSYLWELNFRFILWARDLLDIKTYISISYMGKGCDTTERIAYQLSNYGSAIYLAGKGSAQYLDMPKYERLTKSTIAIVTYTPPTPFSTVSILTPLLLYPREKVLDVLNIRREPIKVIVNGIECCGDYLNNSLVLRHPSTAEKSP